MTEDHRHCIVCGKPTGPDKFFCSPSCEEIFKTQQKRMRRSRLIMLALFIAMFIAILVMSAFRGSS
ncbi:MAG: DUF2116 family Zn-ribbon domain-containing protein [Candidatus Hodarchaeaceae archaeon]|nr:DUF2116 family Zn-ribbon domain-containing protein [Candidatus Hodarchaeaceae archaeon]